MAKKVPYDKLKKTKQIELRHYPAITVAKTASLEARDDQAFRRLFGYINKGNAEQKKIKMTAPVLHLDHGTANKEMAFVLPKLDSVPAPTDGHVRIEAIPAHDYAVLSFKGRATKERLERKKRTLLKRLEKTGFVPVGEAEYAFYNGPAVPPMLRKNEVRVKIRE